MKEYKFRINGNDYQVAIGSVDGSSAEVTVNGTAYKVEMADDTAAAPAAGPGTAVPAQAAPAAPGAGETVCSPLPGVIIDVCVSVGQAVKAGQKVAVLEAMKMENEIQAERDGTVSAIHVSKGESVLEGAKIITTS